MLGMSIHLCQAAAPPRRSSTLGRHTYEADTWSDVERAPPDVALAGGEQPRGLVWPQAVGVAIRVDDPPVYLFKARRTLVWRTGRRLLDGDDGAVPQEDVLS
jgi:hypothetical protein